MTNIGKDLRSYLDQARAAGTLLEINKPADPAAEAPALIRQAVRRGKPVLFHKVGDSDLPVLGNSLGSRTWIETALGCEQGFADWFGDRSATPVKPRMVPTGPVKEVIENQVDLGKLPILTFAAEDGGPYITGGIGIQRDPDTGRQNAGFYSLMFKGPDLVGLRMLASTHGYDIFQRRIEQGLPTEMAIAIGLHPVDMLAAASHTLMDEFELAGALRGEALELVKCETIDVDVPAHAEIVLEGIIRPEGLEPEGPIGDWLGYYPLVEDRHVLRIQRITSRRDPIYQTVLSGSADENMLLSLPRTTDVLRAAKKAASGVVNATLDPFLMICVLQLTKRFDGEAMNAILAAFGEVPFIKICIAVDEDVDIFNMNDVMWAVVTRTRLEQDMSVIGNVMGFSRDPFGHYKTKLAIDATAPVENREHYRRAMVINPEIDLDAWLAD
jgi:2,5-furandicarboxylate decarboxylase 1